MTKFFTTGFDDIDRKIGGLASGEMIVIGARPCMGKTDLAANIALNTAIAQAEGAVSDVRGQELVGGRVAYFSLSVTKALLEKKFTTNRVDMQRATFGEDIEHDERLEACLSEWGEQRASLPIHIDDSPRIDVDRIAQESRRLKDEVGLDVVIVDFLQLLPPSRQRESRSVEIGDMTREFKALARELDVAIVVLSTITRASENLTDPRPRMHDLRDSGAIEEDADLVLLLHRAEVYVERERPPNHELDAMHEWFRRMESAHGKAELYIAKNRRDFIGCVDMLFDESQARFRSAPNPWLDAA